MLKKRILVDQDGVLAHFELGFISKWKKKYPQEICIEFEDRTAEWLDKAYPEHLRPQVEAMIRTPGFYRELEPIPGGKEALNEMIGEGHNVYICTSPLSDYENCVLEKYQWIEEHLGREWTRRTILIKDKTLVHGDFLVDDRTLIKGVHTPSWEHIAFAAPYNRETLSRRMSNWTQWKQFLQ